MLCCLWKWKIWVTQSYPTLCNAMDYSPPQPSVHGILLVRILEWVAIPFFRESSQSRNQTVASHIASRFLAVWAISLTHHYPWVFHSLPIYHLLFIYLFYFFIIYYYLFFDLLLSTCWVKKRFPWKSSNIFVIHCTHHNRWVHWQWLINGHSFTFSIKKILIQFAAEIKLGARFCPSKDWKEALDM